MYFYLITLSFERVKKANPEYKSNSLIVVPFLAVEAAGDASDIKSFIPLHLELKVLSSLVQMM